MKKIYYRNHNALPKAVLASQNENGSWTVEKQAVAGSIPLNEDGFRYAYRDEPRDGDSWTTGHQDFGGAKGIAEAIADGAEPRWLTTKEEVQQWAEKHPEAWFLDLNILGVFKRGTCRGARCETLRRSSRSTGTGTMTGRCRLLCSCPPRKPLAGRVSGHVSCNRSRNPV